MAAHRSVSSIRSHRYTPRHRRREHRVTARTAVLGAAGAVVAAGSAFGLDVVPAQTAGDEQPDAALGAVLHDRGQAPSRGGLGRAPVPGPEGVSVAQAPQSSPTATEPETVSDPVEVSADCEDYSGNRAIGCTLLAEFGYGVDQMASLDALWTHESGWNHLAENPSTGAYGIPQALPGDKMASVADDWRTNPATQIRWGLGYIQDRYGSPDAAWAFFQANGWY